MSANDARMQEAATPRLAYEAGIDGIRGLAVIGVLLFHAGFDWARGGFLGVSVFFTLSGYLITSLLIAERAATSTISVTAFYGRRLRRLAPASMATIVAVLVAAPWLTSPAGRAALPGDAAAALGYVANWRFLWSGKSYAELFGAASPLQHFWSLAIEEQFYIAYPIVMIVAMRLLPARRHLALLLAGLWSTSVVVGLLVDGVDRRYYGTDVRMAELLAGAVLAVVVGGRRPVSDRLATILGTVGVGTLTVLMATTSYSVGWLGSGGFAAVSLLSCAAIIGVTCSTALRSVLGAAPLVLVGKISYGLYLWHWPVFLWLNAERVGRDGPPLFASRVVVTLVLATISFYVLEQPIRRRRLLRSPSVAIGAFGLAAVAIVALIVVRPPVEPAQANAMIAALDGVAFDDDGAVLLTARPDPPEVSVVVPEVSVVVPEVSVVVPEAPSAPSTTQPPQRRVLVLGSAPDVVTRLEQLHAGGAGFAVIDGVNETCPVVGDLAKGPIDAAAAVVDPPGCESMGAVWRDLVSSAQPDVIVVAIGAVERLAITPLDGASAPTLDEAFRQERVAGDRLEQAIAGLRDTELPVLLIDTAPVGDFLTLKLAAVDLKEQYATLMSTADLADDQRALHALESAGTTSADEALRIMVAGDSTSGVFAQALFRAGAGSVDVLSTGRDGCPIVDTVKIRWWEGVEFDTGDCPHLADQWRAHIARFRPDAVIIVASLMEQAELRFAVDEPWHVPGDPEYTAAHDALIDQLVETLAVTGTTLLVADAPRVDEGQFSGSQMAQPDRVIAWNAQITRWTSRWQNVRILDYAGPLAAAESQVGLLRPDGVHVGPDALAELTGSTYLPSIVSLLETVRLELGASGCLVESGTDRHFDLARCRTGT